MAHNEAATPRLEDQLRAMMVNSMPPSDPAFASPPANPGDKNHPVPKHQRQAPRKDNGDETRASRSNLSNTSVASNGVGLATYDLSRNVRGSQAPRLVPDATTPVGEGDLQGRHQSSGSQRGAARERETNHGRGAARGGHGRGQAMMPTTNQPVNHRGRGAIETQHHSQVSHAAHRGQNPGQSMRNGNVQRGAYQGAQQGAHPQIDSPRRQNNQSKFLPLQRPQFPSMDILNAQCTFLEHLAVQTNVQAKLHPHEMQQKNAFRAQLEQTCQELVKNEYPQQNTRVELVAFGSISSGFATTGSDMDLALNSSQETPGLFRLLEKELLDKGVGAHLLSRTRVPIIKICQSPSHELLEALREERQKWDDMTPEERERHDTSAKFEPTPVEGAEKPDGNDSTNARNHMNETSPTAEAQIGDEAPEQGGTPAETETQPVSERSVPDTKSEVAVNESSTEAEPTTDAVESPGVTSTAKTHDQNSPKGKEHEKLGPGELAQAIKKGPPRPQKAWYRKRRLGPLDFPDDGVGVQCDINQANPLGIHNTHLLRCYSLCDPRVQEMIVFVKTWASRRLINSSRNGTLSSYGYVLMVLHFLVNIADPPVCPNLQYFRRTHPHPNQSDPNQYCEGRDIRFWRNEAEIRQLASKRFLTRNTQPLGMLLRNFFFYYSDRSGFIWTQQVLSLRTLNSGILHKEQKGWTGAKTTMMDKNEVRNRYLFAIEDPFELDHNVARTVTHNGIVAIRDEFRRAQRILFAVGRGQNNEDLLAPSDSIQPPFEAEAGAHNADSSQPKAEGSGDADAVSAESDTKATLDGADDSTTPTDAEP